MDYNFNKNEKETKQKQSLFELFIYGSELTVLLLIIRIHKYSCSIYVLLLNPNTNHEIQTKQFYESKCYCIYCALF